jgi:hypothetical protein
MLISMLTRKYLSPLPARQAWPRDYLITILQTGLSFKEYRFARQTAIHWLGSYPGDLPVELIHAQALWGEGHLQQAQKVVERLCVRDPEFLEAQTLLAQILTDLNPGFESDPTPQGTIAALGGYLPSKRNPTRGMPATPKWAAPLREARQALDAKDLINAEKQIQQVLASECDTPLAALTHLRILAAQSETPSATLQEMASHFHRRWPECIQFILLWANALIDGEDASQAVSLLHRAAAFDVTGQVASRLWGEEHPYRDLWPTHLAAVIEQPIPARVASALGWNLLDLPAPPTTEPDFEMKAIPGIEMQAKKPQRHEDFQQHSSKTSESLDSEEPQSVDQPETLRSVQAELESIGRRLQQPALARSEGRYPTYVILTTRQGLRKKYGRAGAAMLEAALQELAETVRRHPDWGALVFFADDPGCTADYEIKPAPADDPWAIKLALTDLDAALAKRGVMIGAVLIVGGPMVVPFHKLPNPTDDPDVEVPSDNPYATRDENYFIPEWPVGRIPGGAGNNPSLLLGALQAISAEHASRRVSGTTWWQQLKSWLRGLFRSAPKGTEKSFGYSAEVWRKASLAVYQQIGDSGQLVTSPPINAENHHTASLQGQLGYFNLHGLAETGEWYGQRDTSNGSSGPDYPVALRVQDIRNGGYAPEVVFSEACYGAYIHEKSADDSLALRFLASGSRGIVGSTVMSYGSISAPLNAADLLGISFWKFIKDGSPVGEALQRAKIYLAREMHKRQGYLDGEDQKTLISFVLYGDPLAQPNLLQNPRIHTSRKRSKTVMRPIQPPPQVKTICDRMDSPGISDPIPEEVLTHVKQVVAQYLPGMQGAQVTLSHEHTDCDCEGHYCPTAQFGAKARPERTPNRRVVTLSKSVPSEKRAHPSFARLTLDQQGKVVKLAVSR